MSKVRAVKTPPDEEEKPRLALVEPAGSETPATADDAEPAAETGEALEAKPADLVVYIDSLGVSMLDRFSLVRASARSGGGRSPSTARPKAAATRLTRRLNWLHTTSTSAKGPNCSSGC